MNGSYNPSNPFELFGAGVGAAWGLFVLEIAIFFWNMTQSYIHTIPANSTETTQVLSLYSTAILWFTIIAILQSAVIGFLGKMPFLLGYLIGVGGLFFILYIYALAIIPSVVYGLGSSAAITLGSLIIRLYLEGQRHDQWGYGPD